ncbi:hypothetical protein CJ030_MR3G014625 [Morella rubra]|uniref:DUF674 domain-containing protein n=1 Tax=Morella rubra TaxID=262757 RepID=A0A6A1VYT8_9ROSI|nr:hypothetical protein CJ030_MR3G014625 [Morella rubra]
MAFTKMRLKLLIDARENRVLFAEAGKDFVDFLVTLLYLPLATVIRLLTDHGMTYLQPNQNMDTLLKPNAPISAADVPLLLPNVESPTRKLYMCSNYHHRNVADDPNSLCPNCNCRMDYEASYIAPTKAEKKSSDEGGYVKGVVTYMVMDDLAVRPMSTISSITLLNKFNVKEVGSLEEREVNVDMAEGLKILSTSLHSKTVLTSVFLGSKGAEAEDLEDLGAQERYGCSKYVSDKYGSACPSCGKGMSYEVQSTAANHAKTGSTSERGYVKDLVTYMVMDDLSVTPISMIAGIAVLNKCNIREFDELEEMMVDFGIDEGLQLLRASLQQSKKALTSVFLVKEESKDVPIPTKFN